MSTVDPAHLQKAAPAPLTEDQQLERDISETIHTVLEFGDVGYERAAAGASVATGLLMQLLRERGYVLKEER